mmetsp:Transcript_13871/g.58750  ORF Transcript_13871/g.58750 Transcript_13871/m.58750 type:complete len:209 (-) Transcript_13871:675-1301(-)
MGAPCDASDWIEPFRETCMLLCMLWCGLCDVISTPRVCVGPLASGCLAIRAKSSSKSGRSLFARCHLRDRTHAPIPHTHTNAIASHDVELCDNPRSSMPSSPSTPIGSTSTSTNPIRSNDGKSEFTYSTPRAYSVASSGPSHTQPPSLCRSHAPRISPYPANHPSTASSPATTFANAVNPLASNRSPLSTRLMKSSAVLFVAAPVATS